MSITAGRVAKILSRLPLERGIVDKIGHEQAVARLHAAAVHGITAGRRTRCSGPSFLSPAHGMNAGTTFDMGSRHTSLPPITSSRNASLYHATLPPVRITTGTLMRGKTSLRRAGCIRSAVQQTAPACRRNQRMFSPTTMHHNAAARPRQKQGKMGFTSASATHSAMQADGQDDRRSTSSATDAFLHAVPPLFSGAAAAARHHTSIKMGRIMGLRFVLRYKIGGHRLADTRFDAAEIALVLPHSCGASASRTWSRAPSSSFFALTHIDEPAGHKVRSGQYFARGGRQW